MPFDTLRVASFVSIVVVNFFKISMRLAPHLLRLLLYMIRTLMMFYAILFTTVVVVGIVDLIVVQLEFSF